jgi:Uma2 family endonuclease
MSTAWVAEVVRPVPREDDRWLLDEDDVPESPLHDLVIDLITRVLRAWVRRTGRDLSVHRNIALRWNPAKHRMGCDPDVCVEEPALPETETSILLWKPGHTPPRVAVEVVSEGTAAKDYLDNPDRYAACGAGELCIFDPLLLGPEESGGPWPLQVYSRRPGGRFLRVYAGEGPAFSEVLGAWWVITEGGRRLRIADDEEGAALWPTDEERAEAEVAARDAEIAVRDAEIAARDAEIARLRAMLAARRDP